MADKQVTVAVPEERVPEFYIGSRSSSPPIRAAAPRGGPFAWGRAAPRSRVRPPPSFTPGLVGARRRAGRVALQQARRNRRASSRPADRRAGAAILRERDGGAAAPDKGAHGVAGILAWPCRYSRKLGREFRSRPRAREDGGTDYYLGHRRSRRCSPRRAKTHAQVAGRRISAEAPGPRVAHTMALQSSAAEPKDRGGSMDDVPSPEPSTTSARPFARSSTPRGSLATRTGRGAFLSGAGLLVVLPLIAKDSFVGPCAR